jgi:hypothetical protein
MAYIIVPSRRLQQPIGRIKLSNNYADIAEAAIDFRDVPRELTTNRPVTANPTYVTQYSSKMGRGTLFQGGNILSYAAVDIKPIGTGSFTWININPFHTQDWGSNTVYPYAGSIENNYSMAYSHPDSASDIGMIGYIFGLVSWECGGLEAPINTLSRRIVAARRQSGTYIYDAFMDNLKGTTPYTYVIDINFTATRWNIGGVPEITNPVVHVKNFLTAAVLFRAYIPDIEMLEIGKNPWLMFTSDPKKLYFDMPATTQDPKKLLTLSNSGAPVDPTLLGTGTPAANKFLRGDGTWQIL